MGAAEQNGGDAEKHVNNMAVIFVLVEVKDRNFFRVDIGYAKLVWRGMAHAEGVGHQLW